MAQLINMPSITGGTADAKISQLQSYMYQLVTQLNYTIMTLESAKGTNDEKTEAGALDASAEAIYDSILPLLKQSTELINTISNSVVEKTNYLYATPLWLVTEGQCDTASDVAISRELYRIRDTLNTNAGGFMFDKTDGVVVRWVGDNGTV